nr:unnamed protein product [Digitaria exilis]
MCCVADVLELTLASTPAGVLDLNSPTSFVAGNGGHRRKLHRARSAVRLLRRLAVALSEAGSSASQSHELLFLLCFPAPPSPSCN